MVFDPVEGLHYPGSTGDFLAWFRSDVDCLDYLSWLRWPNGFVCPTCESTDGGWRLGDGRFMCSECGARTSVTAGTIFDRTRTPLTVWFHACWMLTTQKDGISAQSLQRVLEIGTYKTAWAMLHRLRSALVRPGRERLTGEVEMDELFVGGEEPGLRGGRQKGKKVLVGCAVERLAPQGFRTHPHGRAARREHGVAGRVPRRPRGAGRQPHHRRLVGLPGRDQGQLLPPAHRRPAGEATRASTGRPHCSSGGC